MEKKEKVSPKKDIEDKVSHVNFKNILHSLKVLGSIRENEKLNTKRGKLCISSDSLAQPFQRWIRSENRYDNIEYIENLCNTCFEFCFQLLNTLATKSELRPRQMLKRLVTEMENAKDGINVLKTTYVRDKDVVMRLSLLHDFIDDRVAEIKQSFR